MSEQYYNNKDRWDRGFLHCVHRSVLSTMRIEVKKSEIYNGRRQIFVEWKNQIFSLRLNWSWSAAALRLSVATSSSVIAAALSAPPTTPAVIGTVLIKCQSLAKVKWLDKQKSELLPTGYFHLVFTLPHELNPLTLVNKKPLINILFQSVWQTLACVRLSEASACMTLRWETGNGWLRR
jgi:Transposase zinc-binding domain